LEFLAVDERSGFMSLPSHKTKTIATIGPASGSPEMLERLIRAGLNIAWLYFSHGDFASHAGEKSLKRPVDTG
jgi:pyruvate kinase